MWVYMKFRAFAEETWIIAIKPNYICFTEDSIVIAPEGDTISSYPYEHIEEILFLPEERISYFLMHHVGVLAAKGKVKFCRGEKTCQKTL